MKKNVRNSKQERIIKRQLSEIDNLKQTISTLQISCEEKDKVINSLEVIRQDFLNVVDELKTKKQELEKNISEVMEMRNAFNQIVFKGKWSLIRLLLK